MKSEAHESSVDEGSVPDRNRWGRLLLILLIPFLLEGSVILVAFFVGTGPRLEAPNPPKLDSPPVELAVVKGRFNYLKYGYTLVFDTEVYVSVSAEHADQARETIASAAAAFSTDVKRIIANASPEHFREPAHETFSRQIKVAFAERFGVDEDGNSILDEVYITRLIGYRL